ncbi:hypothetical protein RJ639_047411 [Escallonia herrerae]|uniref:Uncharacterized protein n=1 Tax=Escallonia herrerae TaxID=1293975 RepID=A0AA89B4X7_9ASTE|nr:hypothetical protein RJ639_047411 [Escallonia herrerae]
MKSPIEQIASTEEARPNPGEYWQGIMKDQSMPEAIQGLIHGGTVTPLSRKKVDCHTSTEGRNNIQLASGDDFEPRPTVLVYLDDEKLTEDKSFMQEEKSYVKDFEPRPNALSYPLLVLKTGYEHDGTTCLGKALVTAMIAGTEEARPNPGEYWQGIMKDQPMPEAIQGFIHRGTVTPLSNKKVDCHTSTEGRNNIQLADQEKPSGDEFEPRPNVSVYHDDEKLTEDKSFVQEFEPRPAYHDDEKLTEDKSFVQEFEPRPNVSAYDDDANLKEDKSYVKDFEPRPNLIRFVVPPKWVVVPLSGDEIGTG